MKSKIGIIVVVLYTRLLIGRVSLALAGISNSDTVGYDTRDTIRDEDCTEDLKLWILDRVKLTNEQEQEIKNAVIPIRKDGADHDEIRDAELCIFWTFHLSARYICFCSGDRSPAPKL